MHDITTLKGQNLYNYVRKLIEIRLAKFFSIYAVVPSDAITGNTRHKRRAYLCQSRLVQGRRSPLTPCFLSLNTALPANSMQTRHSDLLRIRDSCPEIPLLMRSGKITKCVCMCMEFRLEPFLAF